MALSVDGFLQAAPTGRGRACPCRFPAGAELLCMELVLASTLPAPASTALRVRRGQRYAGPPHPPPGLSSGFILALLHSRQELSAAALSGL